MENKLLEKDGLKEFQENSFDLIFSIFTYDNIPDLKEMISLSREKSRILKSDGVVINLISSPDVYTNEWASFSTKDFPENRTAESGETVKIIIKDIDDKRPVDDIMWSDKDYQIAFEKGNLNVVEKYTPFGYENEPYQWINETEISPWIIYILKR